jgi:hypothetical protein
MTTFLKKIAKLKSAQKRSSEQNRHPVPVRMSPVFRTKSSLFLDRELETNQG